MLNFGRVFVFAFAKNSHFFIKFLIKSLKFNFLNVFYFKQTSTKTNNTMKTYNLLFVFLCVSLSAVAQQPSQYSLYMFNYYDFNSAYAGLDESVSATGVFREQWVGLQGAPSSQGLNIHAPLYLLSGAVGFGIENDVLGAERNLKITAAYNFQRKIGEGWISAGVRGGILQKTLDGTVLDPREQDVTDNLIPVGTLVSNAFIADAGIFYKNEKLSIGLSANNLQGNAIEFGGQLPISIDFLRNYFLTFAYNFEIGSKFEIQPSLFVKSDVTETQTDISTVVRYNDNIMFGASFRGYSSNTADAVVLLIGARVARNITLAYAYDLPISGLNTTNSGTHEIVLNYNLNKIIGAGIPPKIIYNPRFF
jgi:type IX secretion system PorP/SprF family membrane protein